MASYKSVIVLLVALFALACAAQELNREKKQILYSAPIASAYSVGAYPYPYAAYSAYNAYPYAAVASTLPTQYYY